MHRSTISILAGVRVSFYLSVCFLLLVTLCLDGCNTEQSKQNGPGQSPAGAAPSPSPEPSRKPPGDTVIVIKDGSVKIKFDPGLWVNTGATYQLTNDKLRYVKVTPTQGPSPTPTQCPISNPNSTVKLDAGGGRHDITIVGTSNASSNNISLTFDGGEYGQCAEGYCNAYNNIHQVTINSVPCGGNCAGRKCEVRICTEKSGSSSCP